MLSSIGRRARAHELPVASAPLPLNFLVLKGYCVVIEMRLDFGEPAGIIQCNTSRILIKQGVTPVARSTTGR